MWFAQNVKQQFLAIAHSAKFAAVMWRATATIGHGTLRNDPFSTLGDLDQDTNANSDSCNWDRFRYSKKIFGAVSSPSSNESWPDAGYSSNNNSQNQETAAHNNRLSSSCDYVLCAGYDKSGNEYELVANQTESSRGFEITVGVIKNNS